MSTSSEKGVMYETLDTKSQTESEVCFGKDDGDLSR